LRKKHFKLDTPEMLWPVSLLFLLLSFWFFSTSWRYYSPLPTETRHISFFIPIMIMTAATFWPDQKVFSLFRKRGLTIATICCFLTIPVYSMTKSGRRNFKEQEVLVSTFLVDNPESQWVITDGLNSYGYPYFYDFGTPDMGKDPINDQYIWFSEMNLDELAQPLELELVYVLLNRAYFNEEYGDSENYEKMVKDLDTRGYQLMILEKKGEVSLYHIKKKY